MSVALPWVIDISGRVYVTTLERTPTGQTHVEASYGGVAFEEFWLEQDVDQVGADALLPYITSVLEGQIASALRLAR